MQRTLTLPPLNSSVESDSNAAFNVVIAYEDFETGKQAKNTYDFLVENLGHDCQFTNQMWKFDVLGIPKLREIAVKDAASADIIIISSHRGDLPEAVTAWIESWLQQGVDALALVALFDRPEENPAQVQATRSYLEEVTRRARIGFFAHADQDSAGARVQDTLAVSRPSHINSRTISALSGVVQRDLSAPRWGINE